jgi:hypothetical protein
MCWHGGSTSFKHDSRWRELHVVGQTVTIARGWYLIGGRVHLGMDAGPRATITVSNGGPIGQPG